MRSIICSSLIVLGLGMATVPSARAASTGDHRFNVTLGEGIALGGLDYVPGVSLSTRIGWTFDQIIPFATVDYLHGSFDADGEDGSGGIFTIGGGARYLLAPAKEGETVPYVAAELFSIMPSTKIDDSDVDDVVDSISSFGLLGGFGVEFYVLRTISVSGELGIMRWAASSDYDDEKVKVAILNTYSSILLTFYL